MTSINSPRRSSRSNITGRTSGLSVNIAHRSSGSVHAFSTNSACSNPARPTNKRRDEPRAYARGPSNRNINSSNINNNNNNNSIQPHRKSFSKEEPLSRRRSFKVENDENGRSRLDRNTPNFLLPPADPLDKHYNDSLFEEDYSTGDFQSKTNLNNIRFRSIEDSAISNTSLPVMLDKALVAPDNCIFTVDGKGPEGQVAGVSGQSTDAKTSNNSDSGLSSLSQSSGENSSLAASRIPNPTMNGHGDTPLENISFSDRKNSAYQDESCKENRQDVQRVGTELIRKLSKLPQSHRDEEKVGADSSEEHGECGETRPVLVHGNLKRLGMRRMLVPSPDRGFLQTDSTTSYNNNRKTNGNGGQKPSTSCSPVSAPLLQRKALGGSNSSLNTSVSVGRNSNNNSSPGNNSMSPRIVNNNSISRRQNPRQQLQQRQTSSCYSHPADEKQARLYAIPRNFSRTEAARFPHSYQHGRHRQDSIKTNPGTPKMPSRKIGRFFLVFPFSESTHRLSMSKLDNKAIIKEVQKHLRENLKRSSFSNTQTDCGYLDKERSGEEGVAHIWAPLKSGDVFDY
ncbi:hypothetical protein ElyMa_001408000 [Elysia marginata]|uniref:Uncharacterized protein n=1 Tax=Elysia marginata TaxID=1093978 RepID=A0AAV4IYP7_9GAST|nr:hypothetical protein ElyMa_001408000 [Elysia marginata]